MDLRKLRHAVTLGRVLNFTKAAEELGITQPVLSRSIQSLERQANLRFFDRDKTSVHVTPVGQAFLKQAAQILAEMEELESSLRDVADGRSGVLSFGMGPLPARALLVDLMSVPATDKLDMGFNIPVRDPRVLLAMLEAEAIEFFIAAEAFVPEPANIRGSFIGYFPLAPIVRAGHPLLDPATENRGPFRLLLTAHPEEMPQLPLFLRPHVQQATAGVIEDSDVLAAITEVTDAVWMTSPFMAQRELASGRLVELPFPPEEQPARLRMMEYRLSRRTLSPAAVAMRDRIRGRIQTLSHEREQVAVR